jgi:hypothetical protein
MKPVSEMEDKELYDMIDEAGLAENFLNSPFGKLMKEAANRIAERVDREFAMNADPTDIAKMWELKMTLKKYKFQLFDEIYWLAQDGRDAYDELTARKNGNLEPQAGSEQDS